MKENKVILDACCGSRMFWYDKHNPDVLFADKRTESHILCDGRALEVRPDIEIDFTNMPFDDNTFKVVVFDPPHMTSLGVNSWMAKKYGRLTGNWKEDMKKGFDECIRVLDIYGVLIFKWNEHDVTQKTILDIVKYAPMITQKTGKHNRTIWMTFIKLPTP